MKREITTSTEVTAGMRMAIELYMFIKNRTLVEEITAVRFGAWCIAVLYNYTDVFTDKITEKVESIGYDDPQWLYCRDIVEDVKREFSKLGDK